MVKKKVTAEKLPPPAPVSTEKVISIPCTDDVIRFGVVTDTHLCSKCQQLTFLKHFYKDCAAKGIKTILHAGDLSDGNGHVYSGQFYELFLHSYDDQVEYIVKNYPKEKEITTYVLGGNHDFSWNKQGAGNIVKQVCKDRSDMVYVGMFGAIIKLDGVNIYLAHPDGGTAYALSYRPQKMVESMASENKPHILIIGHFHKAEFLPHYRNVHVIQGGCFQSQTPFLLRKSVHVSIGGWIIEARVRGRGLHHEVKAEFIPFFEPIKNDYNLGKK